MVVIYTQEDLDKVEEQMRSYESKLASDIWNILGLDGKKWSGDSKVIKDSPIIRFTPANLDTLEKICCDVYFVPEKDPSDPSKKGVLFDLGDPFSTKALIESLDFLGYGLEDIGAVYLTHMHADHCGNISQLLNSIKKGPPVLMPQQEFNVYHENPLDVLEPSFRWKHKGDEEYVNPNNGLLLKDPSKYDGQLKVLRDGKIVNGFRHKRVELSDLSNLCEGELGYAVFDQHHQAGDTVYVLGNFIFLGDALGLRTGPLGNKDKYAYSANVKRIKRWVVKGMSKGFIPCLGHSAAYIGSKDISPAQSSVFVG
ncbi:MAG: MBL fold metallo-hydrolase [Nanoarchaeota archaeon]|nr:MBL fold metallo-hydrolase [Nanoarchaeota archaeon]MBU1445404.1 MBL fold metallo-hydrolase [Nanoarchaeota archaeon]MBU2420177.1 MBL fold metallo-hydrolase [Nanoarchaeota archaeon]MBU2475248.1 MBL fold metallo-hydrolase [Nanoarchaeota archaeon]